MKVPSFNEFISEAVENPKLVIITDEPEKAKTFHTADRLQQEAKKLGSRSAVGFFWELRAMDLPISKTRRKDRQDRKTSTFWDFFLKRFFCVFFFFTMSPPRPR